MKKIIMVSLIIIFIVGSGAKKEVKTPIEGAWQLVSLVYVSGDTITKYSQPNPNWSQIKLWTKNHCAFLGENKMVTPNQDLYGAGTYTLVGTHYEELMSYQVDKTLLKTKLKFILEIKNDTLYQTGMVQDDWKLPRQYGIEKYIRIE
jgi:hypothetical protein